MQGDNFDPLASQQGDQQKLASNAKNSKNFSFHRNYYKHQLQQSKNVSFMKTVRGQKVLRRRQKLQGVVNITSESRETGPGLWKNFGEDLFSRTLTGVLHAFAVTFMFGLAI